METYQSIKVPLIRCETEGFLNKKISVTKYTKFFSECHQKVEETNESDEDDTRYKGLYHAEL